MTVADLIKALEAMPQDAEVTLHAPFDGMHGNGPLLIVYPPGDPESWGEETVALSAMSD